jgi:hypothetical protein
MYSYHYTVIGMAHERSPSVSAKTFIVRKKMVKWSENDPIDVGELFSTNQIRTPPLGSVLYLICGPSNSLPLPLFHCRIEDA